VDKEGHSSQSDFGLQECHTWHLSQNAGAKIEEFIEYIISHGKSSVLFGPTSSKVSPQHHRLFKGFTAYGRNRSRDRKCLLAKPSLPMYIAEECTVKIAKS
jgi:hypothetical protein